ncbi:MAG: hypothetical protein LBU53_02620, partial [Zoogloeaceae bacterium]|nr:hypothetical protein [Zoogloeaceae bacterium]
MEFTELGKCVEKTISLANRDNIVIDQYVVMPNHIHMMIVLWSEAGDRGRSPQAANKVAQSVFLSEGFPGNASVHAGSGVCAAICAQSRRTADVPLLP